MSINSKMAVSHVKANFLHIYLEATYGQYLMTHNKNATGFTRASTDKTYNAGHLLLYSCPTKARCCS